jgi:tetratricopeptide (TPR) repeat protein
MSTVGDLLDKIRQCEAKGDLGGIVKLRAQIARDFPGTPEAAEALFRLGVYLLFIENQPDAARQTFEDAIKTKDPNWSKAARVSLASLYLREQKTQKALLELRKALGEKDPPSIHTVSALSIMEAIHEEEDNAAEARKAKEEKVRHIERLLDDGRTAKDDGAVGFFLASLAQEHMALGQPQTAKTLLTELINLGASRVGQAMIAQAHGLMKQLG